MYLSHNKFSFFKAFKRFVACSPSNPESPNYVENSSRLCIYVWEVKISSSVEVSEHSTMLN